MKDIILTQAQTSGQGGDTREIVRGRAFQGERTVCAKASRFKRALGITSSSVLMALEV